MDRLTIRTASGEVWYCYDGNSYGVTTMEGLDVLHVLKRLATYEDTGLEPERIEDLKKFYVKNFEENKRLRAELDHMHDEMDAARDGETIALAELERVTAQRDGLAAYIRTLDIDENVCKVSTACHEDPTEEDCLRCIVEVLGRGMEKAGKEETE